jgi:hypothetical protein
MHTPPFPFVRSSVLASLCLPLASLAPAQDLAVDLPFAPSGFAGGLGGPIVPLLNGLTTSGFVSGVYDSNVNQGVGGNDEDDFILSLGGSVGYQTQGREWTIGATYRGSYDQYMDRGSYSGYNQGASFVAGYQGGKLKVMYNAGFDLDRGSNRYYSTFVERINISQGINASYRLSPKTSLASNLGYSFTKANGGDFSDTESFNFGLSAMWQASPLLSVGPGIRYTLRTGDEHPDRHTFGPTVSANYRLSSKLALTSRLGLDFVDYSEGGGDDVSVSAALGLNYKASALWGMNVSLFRDYQADPALPGAFNEVTSFGVGYYRNIRRATLNLGAVYEFNSVERPLGGGSRGSRDYWSLTSSLGMPIFANTTSASVFMSYRSQSAGGGSGSWDGTQVGFSLARSF